MKNKQRGYTVIDLLVSWLLVLVLFVVIAWGVNAYRLTQCDFEAPYRCELLHGLGVMPPIALITVWVDTDT